MTALSSGATPLEALATAGDQRHGAQGGIANGCLLVCSQFSHALIVA